MRRVDPAPAPATDVAALVDSDELPDLPGLSDDVVALVDRHPRDRNGWRVQLTLSCILSTTEMLQRSIDAEPWRNVTARALEIHREFLDSWRRFVIPLDDLFDIGDAFELMRGSLSDDEEWMREVSLEDLDREWRALVAQRSGWALRCCRAG